MTAGIRSLAAAIAAAAAAGDAAAGASGAAGSATGGYVGSSQQQATLQQLLEPQDHRCMFVSIAGTTMITYSGAVARLLHNMPLALVLTAPHTLQLLSPSMVRSGCALQLKKQHIQGSFTVQSVSCGCLLRVLAQAPCSRMCVAGNRVGRMAGINTCITSAEKSCQAWTLRSLQCCGSNVWIIHYPLQLLLLLLLLLLVLLLCLPHAFHDSRHCRPWRAWLLSLQVLAARLSRCCWYLGYLPVLEH
jgi:hypothetical protein